MPVLPSRYPYQCRIWPNGEFGLSVKPKSSRRAASTPIDYAPSFIAVSFTFSDCNYNLALWLRALGGSVRRGWEKVCPGYLDGVLADCGGDSPLVLTDGTKNHKRKIRGSSGLTSYGRKMIRNGAFLLQRRIPRKRSALCTLTLPGISPEQWKAVSHQWDEILRTFLQWFHRRLSSAGLLPWIVGCVEIQTERMATHGGLPLHVHFVYHARKGGRWGIRTEEMREAWERAVRSRVSLPENLNFLGSVDVKLVRKSCESYISKYLSKGCLDASKLIADGYRMPSTWWFGVGGIKRAIKKLIVVDGANVAASLWNLITVRPHLIDYLNRIFIDIVWEDKHGQKNKRPCSVAYCGKISQSVLVGLLEGRKTNPKLLQFL